MWLIWYVSNLLSQYGECYAMLCYCWPLPMPMPTPRRLRLPCACGALARVGRTKGRTCCVVLCCTVVWCALLLCCCMLCRPLCRSSHQPPAKSSSLQMMKSVREWGLRQPLPFSHFGEFLAFCAIFAFSCIFSPSYRRELSPGFIFAFSHFPDFLLFFIF